MRVLILANIGLGLYKFRRELLEELVKENEVFFCIPNDEFVDPIKKLGCQFIDNPLLDRHGTNPVKELKLISFYKKVIRDVKPDIVFIMSESLFDLYRLNKLDMTADPLASFKALQKEYAGADYISPNLGGGTFASEYEVLTGYRASDTPGALFNNHAVTKDGMDTVVSTLKQAGYYTVAMHPHGSSFYNRAFNYRRFGFDELLFDDTGLP